MDEMKGLPIELVYGVVAVVGGVARYLNGYVNGEGFKLSVFLASAFVSGFGGFMFALLGQSLQMPEGMLWVMAGIGGFFSDQTLKYILEFLTKKVSK